MHFKSYFYLYEKSLSSVKDDRRSGKVSDKSAVARNVSRALCEKPSIKSRERINQRRAAILWRQRGVTVTTAFEKRVVIIKVVFHSDRLVAAAPLPTIGLKIVGGDGDAVMVVSVVVRDDVLAILGSSDLSTTSFMVSEFWRRFCASTCLTSRAS